jgi:YD repeat-containing protein
MRRILLALGLVCTASSPVWAVEICGNGVDDDSDGYTDKGCYPGLAGVDESPLSDTGMVSPSTGSLYYRLPPDVAPRVPFGVPISFGRVYTSMYSPGASPPAYRKPMGDRWQHRYMGWIDDLGTAAIVHLPSGQDMLAVFTGINNGWNMYETHGTRATQYLRKGNGTQHWELRLLDGTTLVYDMNNSNKLIEIWDTLQSPFTNKVTIAYDGNGQVSTVTAAPGTGPAMGAHRLLFGYTASLLTSVQYQVNTSGWVTYHTTSYAYTSGAMTTVTIGGQLAQTNTYVSGYLTQIQDGGGKTIVAFSYDSTTAGKAVRVDTTRGMVGFEYSSSRAACSAKTVLYFNRGNATSCNVDADCGSGFLCGGKTGSGTTGVCFRAGRCLTLDTSSHEDLITSVTPLGPPGESCDGACTDVALHLWSNTSRFVASAGVQDPSGNYSVRAVDGTTGLPTVITYGDLDSNPNNGNAARTVYLFYGDANFPGFVTEVRRKSDVQAGACTATDTTACARTLYSYQPSNGKLSSLQQLGWTRDSIDRSVSFTYATGYSYDAYGRLTQIDGPLGSNNRTIFEYWLSPWDYLKDGFVQNYKREKRPSNFVITSALAYDFWGNPIALQGADTDATHATGTISCQTFDAARGFLAQRREAMAGQADCSTPDGTDLTTSYARDSALRLTQVTRPDGSCMFYEYDSKGRLQRTKRRDDCVAANAGDRQEYVYDPEGLVTEIDTYNAASVLTAKQPYTYYDSRRLQDIVNPVDSSKWTGIYDSRGLISEVDEPSSLGKTVFHRDGVPGQEGRVTSVDKYKTPSTFDTWNQLYDWIGNQFQVTDGDSKATQTVRDDLGRVIKLVSPDMTYPTLQVYDQASRLVTKIEAYNGVGTGLTHTFTFDNINRPLTADYSGVCPTGTAQPEIQQQFDKAVDITGVPTCPAGMNCYRTGGRLAYVKVSLFCSSAYSSTDGSLDQETWYSYDDAGRVVREYIKDDSGRVADHQYTWTKNGALNTVTLPSGAVVGWEFGSAGSNSDTDLITKAFRTNTSTPVIDTVLWNPYGPLQQYNQEFKTGGVLMRTRITRNLAYRISQVTVERQTGTNPIFTVALAEDAKGRVTKRDFTVPNSPAIADSYFLYDQQDRVVCETTNLVTTCPTSGSTLKNNHSASPPFTNAGDWLSLLRPIAGSTGGTKNGFNPGGYGTSHQVNVVRQDNGTPALGDTTFLYDARGNRVSDDNATQTNDSRTYSYDARRNVVNVHGRYFTGGVWHDYDVASAFDARNRRVFKSFYDNVSGKTATWFFYYDALDRLSELRYTPDISAAPPVPYSVFQLHWLGDRMVMYWQTDYPAVTTTKRYTATDETGRPHDMWTWPATGNGTRVWSITPSAWGLDTNLVGPTVFQPLLFAGQYKDTETAALENDGTNVHRPGVVLNGWTTYDPFVGGFLQVDPFVPQSLSSYVYAWSNPVARSEKTPNYDAGLHDGHVPWTSPGSITYYSNCYLPGYLCYLPYKSTSDLVGQGEIASSVVSDGSFTDATPPQTTTVVVPGSTEGPAWSGSTDFIISPTPLSHGYICVGWVFAVAQVTCYAGCGYQCECTGGYNLLPIDPTGKCPALVCLSEDSCTADCPERNSCSTPSGGGGSDCAGCHPDPGVPA